MDSKVVVVLGWLSSVVVVVGGSVVGGNVVVGSAVVVDPITRFLGVCVVEVTLDVLVDDIWSSVPGSISRGDEDALS